MTDVNTLAQGYGSQARPGVSATSYNALAFVFKNLISRINTIKLVEVVSCTNSGGVSAIGRVDVMPMVNQIAGDVGMPMPQLSSLPYFRIQGGTNAVIIDPQPGDIGVALFADRDISSVKAAGKTSNPGSARMFDLSDGLFIGSFIGASAPTQYIQFVPGGINVYSPTAINVTAPAINIGSNGGTLHQLVTDALEALFNAHTHPIPGGGSTSATTTPMSSAQLTSVLKAD